MKSIINNVINEHCSSPLRKKVMLKRGFLELMAHWCPYWILEPIGLFCLKVVRPLKYGYMRYKQHIKFLEESQWWTPQQLESYQLKRLQSLLEHAYGNVPYYKDIFTKLRLTPDDFKSLKDLEKLPLLTKEDVVNNFDRLVAKNFSRKERKRRMHLSYTSGSTGKSMIVCRDNNYKSIAFSNWRMNLINIRVDNNFKYIQLWSRPFIEQKRRCIKLYEPYWRRLSLSSMPQPMEHYDDYLYNIKEFKPSFIVGSPSFMYLLALYARENNFHDIRFPVFINCYENLYSFQRNFIQQQFQCEVFNYYSSEEGIFFAVECNEHKGMHLEARKGLVEIVDDFGRQLPRGERGKIICTGFDNEIMPLIRYEIGDIGVIGKEPCSCGRGLPLLESFDGRTSEMLHYGNKYIYPSMLSVILEKCQNIKECQFVQEKEDTIKVNVVPRNTYSSQDTEALVNQLKHIFDKDLNIDINFVEHIPRTKMGKFQFVINRLAQ